MVWFDRRERPGVTRDRLHLRAYTAPFLFYFSATMVRRWIISRRYFTLYTRSLGENSNFARSIDECCAAAIYCFAHSSLAEFHRYHCRSIGLLGMPLFGTRENRAAEFQLSARAQSRNVNIAIEICIKTLVDSRFRGYYSIAYIVCTRLEN